MEKITADVLSACDQGNFMEATRIATEAHERDKRFGPMKLLVILLETIDPPMKLPEMFRNVPLGQTRESDRWCIQFNRWCADQESPLALYLLALCYMEGDGVQQDMVECMRLMKMAAEKGFVRAQFLTGLSFMTGSHGNPCDKKQAVKWLQLALDHGYNDALIYLGLCYKEGGGGIDIDDVKAFSYFRSAASDGNVIGRFLVGHYLSRSGPGQDMRSAYKEWINPTQSGHLESTLRAITLCAK